MSSKVDEHSLSEVLRALADDAARERIFVRDLVEALGDRALAARWERASELEAFDAVLADPADVEDFTGVTVLQAQVRHRPVLQGERGPAREEGTHQGPLPAHP